MAEQHHAVPPDCPARTGDILLLREQMGALNGKVDDLKVALVKLTDSMDKLTRLEMRHEQVTKELQTMREQGATDLQTMRDAISRLATRVDAIEPDMPALRDLRKRVNAALWALAGVIGLSLLSLVMLRGAAAL
ncbi:MAG TPA: hypothetical protein PKD25_01580 [Rubrivivax sp.]|nr:hypothetical protein [Rubrivivax sp.]